MVEGVRDKHPPPSVLIRCLEKVLHLPVPLDRPVGFPDRGTNPSEGDPKNTGRGTRLSALSANRRGTKAGAIRYPLP